MAILGHTELQAVNQMLAAVGQGSVGAISGNDDAEIAQQFIDHWTREIQTRGLASNMRHKTYSAATDITVGSDVVRVRCVAPGRYADNIVLKADKLHCTSEDSNVIATDVHCHIWVYEAFETSPPEAKLTILAEATQDFVARFRQRPELMQVLEKQTVQTGVNVDRPSPNPEGNPPTNSIPSVGNAR